MACLAQSVTSINLKKGCASTWFLEGTSGPQWLPSGPSYIQNNEILETASGIAEGEERCLSKTKRPIFPCWNWTYSVRLEPGEPELESTPIYARSGVSSFRNG